MYYNYEVKLIRDNEVIKKAIVKEYDGDCLDANLFYDALDVFENDLKQNDVIEYFGSKHNKVLYNLENNGFINLC